MYNDNDENDDDNDVNDDDYSVPSEEQIKKTWDDVIQKNKTNENIDKLKNIRDDIIKSCNSNLYNKDIRIKTHIRIFKTLINPRKFPKMKYRVNFF